MLIGTILSLILMGTGLNGGIMTQPKWITDIQLQASNLAPIASEVDSLMSNRGYAPAGEFLTNIAGQESLYGHPSVYNPKKMSSLGITQIDAGTYQDIIGEISRMQRDYPKAEKGYGADAEFINKYMRSKGKGYEDFDIGNLATVGWRPLPVAGEGPKGEYFYSEMSKHASNPMANLLLTRMLLSMDKKTPIPQTDEEQAKYWKKKYNTYLGKGTPEEFLEKIKTYRPVESTMNNHNKVKF